METTLRFDPETQAIINRLMHGTPIDFKLADQIRKRGDQIREEIRRKYGVADIGDPAIREIRGPLPQ